MATSDKYDRQLRLWGSNGQRALMESNILLINADAVGTEVMKNLVLPGIGKFVVLDDNVVTEKDLGCNFFVDGSKLGKSRAQSVTELLIEMNPDVSGSYEIGNIATIEAAEPGFFNRFNLIIAANIEEQLLLRLSSICNNATIPLIIVRSYGYIGYCRLQINHHTIIESKPDGDQYDLRIVNPFPELHNFFHDERFDLLKLNSLDHAHVPFVILLSKALQAYKLQNNGSLPQTFAQKNEFKQFIKDMRHHDNEMNFAEALKEAYRGYTLKSLPDDVIEISEICKGKEITSMSSASADLRFLLLMKALDVFMINNNGDVPLGGQLPDMTATTSFYIDLQRVYQKKAEVDRATLRQYLDRILMENGLPLNLISAEEVDIFCKNIFCLRMITTRTLFEERASLKKDDITTALEEPYDDPVQIEGDIDIVWGEMFALAGVSLNDNDEKSAKMEEIDLCDGGTDAEEPHVASLADLIRREHAAEIVRCGGGEVHTISALIGGIAGQEAVKIITHQYLPMNNTYIFNGVAGCGGTYEL